MVSTGINQLPSDSLGHSRQVPVPVHQSRHPAVPSRRAGADGLLCFQLTGGTTGASKCVEIAQRMALHEFKAYAKAFPELSHEVRDGGYTQGNVGMMLEKLVQGGGTSGRLGVELFWGRIGLLVPTTSSDLSQLVYQDRILQHTPVLWAASAIGQINIAASFGARLCIADELDQVPLGRNRAVHKSPTDICPHHPTPSFIQGFRLGPCL